MKAKRYPVFFYNTNYNTFYKKNKKIRLDDCKNSNDQHDICFCK